MRQAWLATIAILLAGGARSAPAGGGAAYYQTNQPATPVRLPALNDAAGAGRVERVAAPQAAEGGAPDDRQPPLTPVQAIAAALQNNPDLRTVRLDEPVSRAALDAARAYPFAPTAAASIAPSPRDDLGDTLKSVVHAEILQTFQLAGQRRIRSRAGAAQLQRTLWAIRQAAAQTAAEAERRYFTAVYYHELRETYRAAADLADQLLDLLERRFAAGQASDSDVVLTRMDARSSHQQAVLAETQYVGAIASLRAYLGFVSDSPIELIDGRRARDWLLAQWSAPALTSPTGGEPGAPPGPMLDRCEQLALTRPDVLAAEADLKDAQAQFDLARANLAPNVRLGPFYDRDEANLQSWGVAAETELGVAHTSQGKPLVRQRLAELQQKSVSLEQARRKALLDVRAAALRYDRARRAIEQFGGQLQTPLAEEVQHMQDLFDAGQADVLSVFAARKTMIQLRVSLAESLNELGQAAADLAAATGSIPDWIQFEAAAP